MIFTNDNNIQINLLGHNFDNIFSTRDNHEVLFRKINTYLINNNYIKGNIIDSGAWIGDNSLPWAKNISGIVFSIDPSYKNCINDKEEILYTNDNINHCILSNNPDSKNSINSTSLDILLEENKIYNIDYIHLDVEFMEFKAINGSLKLINKYNPIITFEQHIEKEDYMLIVDLLKDKKYSVYLINEILLGCYNDCRNFIAFPYNLDSNNITNSISAYLNIDNLFINY